jgi:hypothetical protein
MLCNQAPVSGTASRVQNRIATPFLSQSHGGALKANLDATANANLHFAQKALSRL